jgi:uncharacterized protein YjiS (DUF1127 family)
VVSDFFNASPASISNPVRGLSGWLIGRVHGLIKWGDRRAAIKALHQLDDRELRDIGLTRDRIEAAVSGFTRAESELGRFG